MENLYVSNAVLTKGFSIYLNRLYPSECQAKVEKEENIWELIVEGNRIITEEGKVICCLGFLRELVCSRESKTWLLIKKSVYFKGVDDAFKVRRHTDVWHRE